MLKHPDQRVVVLMDVSNLYHSAKNLYKARVNFREVLKTAISGRKFIRAVAYVIRTEEGEAGMFFEALQRIGIEIKMKDLQIFAGGAKKGDWDVGMTVDAIKFSDVTDALVIVSGDGDFTYLLEYLKATKGCRLEVIAFGRTASARLKEAADEFVDLDESPEKFLLRNKQ